MHFKLDAEFVDSHILSFPCVRRKMAECTNSYICTTFIQCIVSNFMITSVSTLYKHLNVQIVAVIIKGLEEKLYVATKENLTLEEDLQEKTNKVILEYKQLLRQNCHVPVTDHC